MVLFASRKFNINKLLAIIENNSKTVDINTQN